jgi:DNA adenine methylase
MIRSTALSTASPLAIAPAVNSPDRARPFLKWAGGKRQLLPQLRRFVPATFEQYFEPFLGSGALFFDLASTDRIDGHNTWLTDVNRDLLGTYCALAAHAEDVIAALVEHERLHRKSQQEHFYRVRDLLFNPQRSPLFGASRAARIEDYSPALAAMFIYLNRTGFNGLFRLNSRGEFNVPAGRYANPRICDADNIRAVAEVLSTQGVKIRYGGFELALKRAKRNDLLYFDPPYAPVSDTANFTGYTAFGFTNDDQRQLQQVIIELAHRGCHVILSNSTAPIIRELYDENKATRKAGLQAHKVAARRSINSKASHRGDVAEYIISNVIPTE